MPRPLAILPAVITVTMVGRWTHIERWMFRTFRVRRAMVARALSWLKVHNPRYYGNISIDDALLSALPEDNVPDELRAVVGMSDAEGLPPEEADGYTPMEDDEGISVT